jgi:hypothetical protein
MGFRVPLIVVSAYTPQTFISNRYEDFGSVVLIERDFGIMEGALTFADSRGGSTELTEYFSLGNPPRTFTPISTPLSAQHFIDTPSSDDPPEHDTANRLPVCEQSPLSGHEQQDTAWHGEVVHQRNGGGELLRQDEPRSQTGD